MYHLVDQCWKDNRIFLIKRYLVTLRGRRKWLSTIDLPLGDLPFNSDPLWRERAVFHARFMLHVYSSRAPFAQGIVFIESSLWIDHYLNVPLEEGRRCSLIRFSGFDVTNLPPSLPLLRFPSILVSFHVLVSFRLVHRFTPLKVQSRESFNETDILKIESVRFTQVARKLERMNFPSLKTPLLNRREFLY